MVITNERNDSRTGSSYLEYLPGIYHDDEFMGQYLKIFEDILGPIENMIHDIASYFDPLLTPAPLLPWLAGWLDLVLSPSWPMEKRRELLKNAAWLYRWRGTKRGLAEFLRIYTGSVPEISEYLPGMRLDTETRLGENSKLGSAGTGHHFTVSVTIEDEKVVKLDTVRAIIESQKPAHTVYTLQVRRG